VVLRNAICRGSSPYRRRPKLGQGVRYDGALATGVRDSVCRACLSHRQLMVVDETPRPPASRLQPNTAANSTRDASHKTAEGRVGADAIYS
jgi:hypothetical protein